MIQREDIMDKAHLPSPGGLVGSPSEEHLFGIRQADDIDEAQDSGPVIDDAQSGRGHGQTGGFDRDANVAAHGQLASRAESMAVDQGDDRVGEIGDRPQASLQRVLGFECFGTFRRHVCGDCRDIIARRESGLPSSADH